MRIFVTGGTGLIGTRSSARCGNAAISGGAHAPTGRGEAGRGRARDRRRDPTQRGPGRRRAHVRCIDQPGRGKHLGKRWLRLQDQLRESRIKSTEHCVQAIAKNPKRPDGSAKVLISARRSEFTAFTAMRS